MLLFYTLWKHQKTFRFSDVFRGYRKAAPGCNGLSKTGILMKLTKNLVTVVSSLWTRYSIEKIYMWNIELTPPPLFAYVRMERRLVIKFMSQLEYSSKWSQMCYSNAPEKNEKLLWIVKNRTVNVIFEGTSFIVCMLSNSGKGKAENRF